MMHSFVFCNLLYYSLLCFLWNPVLKDRKRPEIRINPYRPHNFVANLIQNFMRKRFLLILAALLPLSVFHVFADENTEVKQKIPLELRPDNLKDNRSILQIPIESTYWGMMNLIQTSVSGDLGEITIEVMNESTGEFWSDSYDTAIITQTVLPISGTTGIYNVTYLTESGEFYEGCFTID